MNLLTKELQTQLEKISLYEQDELGDEAKVLVRFHVIGTESVWLITEASKEENSDDYILYGYCHIFEWEWGYVRLSEIDALTSAYKVLVDYTCADSTVSECVTLYTRSKVGLSVMFLKKYLEDNLSFYLQDIFDELTITTKPVYKDERELTGIMVCSKNHNLVPVFYVELLYEELVHSQATLDIFMYKLLQDYNNNLEYTSTISCDSLLQNIENNIFACVIPKDSTLLKDKSIYYEEFLDMAIVYRIYVSQMDSDGRFASALISNRLIAANRLDSNLLRQYALNGGNRFNQYCIKPITEIINIPGKIPFEAIPLYVVSNKVYMYGASAILSDYLREVAEVVGSEFYILPSSKHELLVVSTAVAPDKDYCLEMVKQINDEVVSIEDKLTDSVYVYSIETGLSIA